jgi:hypothetical protein
MEDEIFSVINFVVLFCVLMFGVVILEDMVRQWLRQRKKIPPNRSNTLSRADWPENSAQEETVREKDSSIVTKTNRPLWPKI